jgi:hypothetical protein
VVHSQAIGPLCGQDGRRLVRLSPALRPQSTQVCLDEIHKTLRSTPRGEIPLQPGKARREDYEYERHGHCALFLAVEPLAGFRRVWVHERRTLLDCADVLRDLVDVVYPDAERIVLVVDNLNIHHPACLYERLKPAEARRIAECELSVLKRQCLRSRLPDMATVQRKVAAWQDRRNERQVTVDCRFTTEDARIKLRRLYPVVNVQESD